MTEIPLSQVIVLDISNWGGKFEFLWWEIVVLIDGTVVVFGIWILRKEAGMSRVSEHNILLFFWEKILSLLSILNLLAFIQYSLLKIFKKVISSEMSLLFGTGSFELQVNHIHVHTCTESFFLRFVNIYHGIEKDLIIGCT